MQQPKREGVIILSRKDIWESQILPHIKAIFAICREHNIPCYIAGNVKEPGDSYDCVVSGTCFVGDISEIGSPLIVGAALACKNVAVKIGSPLLHVLGAVELARICAAIEDDEPK